jgi:hypothetical protein
MPLRVINSAVSNNSITITFSDPVDTSTNVLGNYTVFDPGSVDFSQPQALVGPVAAIGPQSANGLLVTINFAPSTGSGTNEFQNGDWVHVTVKNVTGSGGTETLEGGQASFARQVPGGNSESRRVTRDVEDAVTYPLLTEQVSFPRSGGGPTTGVSSSQGGSLGQTAALAIGDVLGWKVSGTDPKGFVGALTQAFTLTDVEGHVESKWNARTFAVQTDLGGGISGAQASLYTRAKDALDQSLSLLDGLYPLDPEADPEYVRALREMARSQMTEIVREFGAVGLPSILRIDTYFEILLGQHPTRHSAPVQFDPDLIGGTLGQLRKTYGIYFRGNPFNNSIEDEQDITNFRVISDYMTSLMQSWIANREFFIVSPNRIAFFGTQLVLISRQLNVIAETVDEVRFALDSVFIGPNERQTLLLKFTDHSLPPMFLEDVLEEIEKFVEDEGPRLLRDGGKISVTNNILPVVRSLKHMVEQAHDPENKKVLPDGFKTARVRHSLDDLQDQLGELIKLTTQVEQQVPLPDYALAISGITAVEDPGVDNSWILSLYGDGYVYGLRVTINSSTTLTLAPSEFYSAERIEVTIDTTSWGASEQGSHDITVTNPDGESATLTDALNWDSSTSTLSVTPRYGSSTVNGSAAAGGSFRSAAKARALTVTTPDGLSTSAQAPAARTTLASAPAGAVASAPASAQAASAPAPPAVTPEQVTALHSRIDEMQKSHETLFQRLEDKMSDFFEGKNKAKKSKDDD